MRLSEITRRDLLKGAGAAALAGTLGSGSTAVQANNDVSQFELNGVKLGMTVEEVANATGAVSKEAEQDEFGMYTGKQKVVPAKNMVAAIRPFKAFGNSDWTATETNNKLTALLCVFKPDDFVEMMKNIEKEYGKPTDIKKKIVQNGMGAKFENFIVSWKVEDASITIHRFFNKITSGSIIIQRAG